MKYVWCLLMLVSIKTSFAQNLVQNPSFEDTMCIIGYGCCPEEPGELTVKDWVFVHQSPDYFNSCANASYCDVPMNFGGNRMAATGNAYAGFSTKIGNNYPNYRETIGAKLLQPLVVGTEYYVSMKVCLADSANCATNNIGMLFTTQPYHSELAPYPDTIPGYSQLFTTTIIADKENWTIISGSIVADSAYEYISIGNFLYDSAIDTLIFDSVPVSMLHQSSFPDNCWSYYYVDDVCVSTDSLECDLNTSSNHQPVQSKLSIYPTITHQAVTITFPQSSTHFHIFNTIGQSVYNGTATSLHRAVDISQFSAGIYFIRVQTHQGVQTAKFVVQHQ